NWRGDGLELLGKGGLLAVMTPFQRGTIFVNTNLVDPKEFKSYKDLLAPKWKGKMAVDDPTKPGPGQATFTFFYLHPDLGSRLYPRPGQTGSYHAQRLYHSGG
ncbi:MAG: hypothetical protein ACE10C_10105, partial [Candidatus Binatia bacterium]